MQVSRARHAGRVPELCSLHIQSLFLWQKEVRAIENKISVFERNNISVAFLKQTCNLPGTFEGQLPQDGT